MGELGEGKGEDGASYASNRWFVNGEEEPGAGEEDEDENGIAELRQYQHAPLDRE
jgi:hypothetical protein